jgi:hypothetical protein
LPREEPETWDAIVRHHIDEMKNYFDHLLERIEEGIPCLSTRFENLMKSPEESLKEVFSFIYNGVDLEGTNLEMRIRDVLAMGHKAT